MRRTPSDLAHEMDLLWDAGLAEEASPRGPCSLFFVTRDPR